MKTQNIRIHKDARNVAPVMPGVGCETVRRIKMKPVLLVFVGLFVVLTPLARAEETSRDALAEKFLTVTKQEEQTKQMLEQLRSVIGQLTDQLLERSKLSAKKRDILKKYVGRVADVFQEELKWEKIKAGHIDIVASAYSESELSKLIGFFESQPGKTYVQKQQLVLQKVGESSREFIERVMPKIHQIDKEMKKELKR
ncbi:MAG: DUF2059 domain-containing protein [Desulfobacterales bacterium]|nr:DUF2059 domain-containing protein [Desulfobacterales bacterium]